jgi:transcriptional regulator with XRE-family HTH domain
MSSEAATSAVPASVANVPAPVGGLGDRVRALRVGKGLTQTDLAGDRFSKEYISQIERGKTRPTTETVGWLAERLGVDPEFLTRGVAADVRDRVEALLAQAEAMSVSHRYDEAVTTFREARSIVASAASAELEARALSGEGWALMQNGEVREAIDVLQVARALTELPQFSDVERADVLFRLGCCRYKLSSIATAVALLDEALMLAERSGLPSDRLRAQIYSWRSRCRRRQRDFEAAREDAMLALELARASDDPRVVAGSYFQASFVAEKMGHLILAPSTPSSTTSAIQAASCSTWAASSSCSASPSRRSST